MVWSIAFNLAISGSALCLNREFTRGLSAGPAGTTHVAVPELGSGALSGGGEGNGAAVRSGLSQPSRHASSL